MLGLQTTGPGFGHTDNRHGVGHPRRYPIDWVFCSQRCQNAFHALYGNWLRVKGRSRRQQGRSSMIDPSDVELAAMKKCLKAFGEAQADRLHQAAGRLLPKPRRCK